ncbi:conserved hypothetical protein [Talaromyces stipitatus ATCC 10500]|uniref:S-adenosyl-L-methionine-dependent methyltransferase n=1 Tax=Talaromyces stipitatus (strain ATCC 10500 / CBS 375.48 / QM 6759 / NRRL 1006) TaxID=441959 RepID=B8M326_TALSN|nr:uncharacterized protein TSTA_092450 [Talaromyces stipitatus ATCC 10500]EED22002.1 conserved hypothetical protein [Talaromyces stipitatus ATCC 10500]
MSLDLDSVDYSFQDGQLYVQKDDDLDSISSPYDEEEVERLELMHLIFTTTSDGYLHLAPINPYPQRILDIGCGTGTWCIEMADSYQSAEVIGVELSPSQPILVPPNLSFEIDGFEQEWTYSRSFDLIHARLLAGRILDWHRLMRRCFE